LYHRHQQQQQQHVALPAAALSTSSADLLLMVWRYVSLQPNAHLSTQVQLLILCWCCADVLLCCAVPCRAVPCCPVLFCAQCCQRAWAVARVVCPGDHQSCWLSHCR
jgi:hypothetical protein